MLEKAFGLMLATVFELFHSIFFGFCHLHPDFACWSSPRVGVGVGPNSLNLGLGLGFNPNPNPALRDWGGVSPDSGTRGWGWG